MATRIPLLGLFLLCLIINTHLATGLGNPGHLSYAGHFCTSELPVIMECPTEYVISISDAMFGLDTNSKGRCGFTGFDDDFNQNKCKMTDVLNIVTKECKGRANCTFVATEEMFSNGEKNCDGASKELRISYNCVLPVLHIQQCMGILAPQLEFSCPAGKKIAIVDAFWGRMSADICPSVVEKQDTNCNNTEAAMYFETLCKNKNSCSICTDGHLGDVADTCPSTKKYLNVSYVCAECRNIHNDDDCEYWKSQDQCNKNKNWMTGFCRRTCWGCSNITSDCKDTADDCACMATYGKCNGDDEGWMNRNCPYSCNTCGNNEEKESELTTTTGRPCVNRDSTGRCEEWVSQGECDTNKDWMTVNCQKSCDRCSAACSNLRSDSICEEYKEEGECEENPEWMYDFCKMTCDVCDLVPTSSTSTTTTTTTTTTATPTTTTMLPRGQPMSCVDRHSSVTQCRTYATNGECKTNPVWMLANCRRSCGTCLYGPQTMMPRPTQPTISSACQALSDIDADCEIFATTGECELNPRWMLGNCGRSCCGIGLTVAPSTTITTTPATTAATTTTTTATTTTTSAPLTTSSTMSSSVCKNSHGNDTACKLYALAGECDSNPNWMLDNCEKACSACPGKVVTTSTPHPQVTTTSQPPRTIDCTNTNGNDTLCTIYAQDGECENNPNWMFTNCERACGACALGITSSPDPLSSTEATTTRSTTSATTSPTTKASTTTTTSTPSTTSTATSSTTPSTIVTTICEDRNDECGYWTTIGECEENPSYMQKSCQLSCGICKSTHSRMTTATSPTTPVKFTKPSVTTITTTIPESTSTLPITTQKMGTDDKRCINSFKNDTLCQLWAASDLCYTDTKWMMKNCYLACSKCGQSTSACINDESDVICSLWVRSGHCRKEPTFMLLHCRKACDFCEKTIVIEETTTTPKPTTTTTTVQAPALISCTGGCVNGICTGMEQCTCSEGWMGARCDRASCVQSCGIYGTCIGNNECTCDKGWSGDVCDVPICGGDCNGRGVCVAPNKCLCYPYWTGASCEHCGVTGVGRACLPCPSCVSGTCMPDGENTDSAYLGCYADPDLNDLEHLAWRAQNTTTWICVRTCHVLGFRYAGTQNGNQCRCGNSYGSHGAAGGCSSICQGGHTREVCGGMKSNSIYKVQDGICQCQAFYAGRLCDRCADGFWGSDCRSMTPPTQLPATTQPPLTTTTRPPTTTTTTMPPTTSTTTRPPTTSTTTMPPTTSTTTRPPTTSTTTMPPTTSTTTMPPTTPPTTMPPTTPIPSTTTSTMPPTTRAIVPPTTTMPPTTRTTTTMPSPSTRSTMPPTRTSTEAATPAATSMSTPATVVPSTTTTSKAMTPPVRIQAQSTAAPISTNVPTLNPTTIPTRPPTTPIKVPTWAPTPAPTPTPLPPSTPKMKPKPTRIPHIPVNVIPNIQPVMKDGGPKTGALNLTIVFPGVDWQAEFKDPSLTVTRLFTEKIVEDLNLIYKVRFDLVKNVEILRLRNGSVTVDYHVQFEYPVDDVEAHEVECYMYDYNKNGQNVFKLRTQVSKPLIDVCSIRETQCTLGNTISGVQARTSSGRYYCKCKSEYYGKWCKDNYRSDLIMYAAVAVGALLAVFGVFVLCCCIYAGRSQSKIKGAKLDYGTGTRSFKYYDMEESRGTISGQNTAKSKLPKGYGNEFLD